jgi:hypothetical protein
MQLGFNRIDGKKDFDPAAAVDFLQSSQYYVQAAEQYPDDDEERPYFLAVALEALWWAEAPLDSTLPLCRKIRAAMAKPAQIWEFSQMSLNKRNANCHEAVQFLDDCEKKLVEGTATLDDALMPPDLMERRAGKISQLRDE